MIKFVSKLMILSIFFSFQSSENKLDEFMETLRGKVVYIDVWATWCKPCVENLKHTKKLAETITDKDVAIVYMSIDGDKTKWENLSKREGIFEDKNNVMIGYVNAIRSNTLKNAKIDIIPRYLIFNKKGELVNGNAPNPKRIDRLQNIFEKYLKE